MKVPVFIFILMLCSCSIQYNRHVTGLINDKELSEISGLTPSTYHPGLYWVHNDGGNPPYLFLIDTAGTIHAKVKVGNGTNRDWEDIAQGVENGTSYLFIGDIGDNKKQRKNVQIYKVKEPSMDHMDHREFSVTPEVMNITYSNGSRDAEALMYDPKTGELILVTKREIHVQVYSFPFVQGNHTVAAKGTVNHHWITAGDINNSGDILLKNYGHVFFWSNSEQKSTIEQLTQTNSTTRYRREPLGEAICWKPTGGFLTISERLGQKPVTIYQYLPELKSP